MVRSIPAAAAGVASVAVTASVSVWVAVVRIRILNG